MSINDIPVLSALRTKMQWHQERQRVLAENIANSNTPNFRPRDLVEPKFDAGPAGGGRCGTLPMMRTSAGHMARSGAGIKLSSGSQGRLTRPAPPATRSIWKTR